MKKLLLVLVVITVLLASCSSEQPEETPYLKEDSELAGKIDEMLASYAEPGYFSGDVLIEEAGEVILHKAYGYADAENGRPNTVATKFQIASITKPFTAVAILQLYEQGKLQLDDEMREYLDFPDTDGITIRRLLGHRTGIENYTSIAEFNRELNRDWKPEALVRICLDHPRHFEPGASFEYSNTNYLILGLIIEAVTGQSYYDYVEDHVLKPVGMHDTGFKHYGRAVDGMAHGYTTAGKDGDGIVPAEPEFYAYAAGGLYSTAADLLRFKEALMTGKLISRETFEQMLTAQDGYGLGMSVAAPLVFGHDGLVPGFISSFSHDANAQRTIVILSNSDTTHLAQLQHNLRDLFAGDSPALKPEVPQAMTLTDAQQALFDGLPMISEHDPLDLGGTLAIVKTADGYEAVYGYRDDVDRRGSIFPIVPVNALDHAVEFRFKYVQQWKLTANVEDGKLSGAKVSDEMGRANQSFVRQSTVKENESDG